MKNVHFIIEGVLAAAIAVLFSMHINSKKTCDDVAVALNDSSSPGISSDLPLVFINVDSLLSHYIFSSEMNEKLNRKRESSLATINQKGKELEAEIAEFGRKIQNNAFLSQERAKQEEQRLAKKEQDFQQMQQRLSNELQQEQMAMNEQLRDSVNSFLRVYNKTKGYQIIFSNTFNDNILYSEDKYDITSDVIRQLNARYVPQSK